MSFCNPKLEQKSWIAGSLRPLDENLGPSTANTPGIQTFGLR